LPHLEEEEEEEMGRGRRKRRVISREAPFIP